MHEQFRYIYRKIIRRHTLLTRMRVIIWKLQALYYCLLVRASRGERFVTWTFSKQPQKYIDSVKKTWRTAVVSSTSTTPSHSTDGKRYSPLEKTTPSLTISLYGVIRLRRSIRLVSKFPRKMWGIARAQTVYPRRSFSLFFVSAWERG